MVRKAFRFVAFAIAGLVAVVTAAVLLALPFGMRGMDEVRSQTVVPLDMGTVADGVHEGQYCHARWCYKVRARVAGGRIDCLWTVQPKDSPSDSFNRKVYKQVLERQNVFADAVSGASITTRAVMKAVENALRSGPVEVNR